MRAALRPLQLTHRRGRCLPHLTASHVPLFITFRLADSLPRHVVERLAHPGVEAPPAELRKYRRRLEEALDAGHGACVLRDPVAAAIVERLLLAGHGRDYELLAWCVMPNHVHVIVVLRAGRVLSDVVRRWKGASSRFINLHLGRMGTLWQPDYFDRVVASARVLEKTVEYVERNPVEAGLVLRREEWAHSSAGRGMDGGARFRSGDGLDA